MSKETESTEDALIYRIGQMVKENVELEQRVHQLVDDYNEVVHQLHGLEKRKDEDTAKHTLDETLNTIALCEKLEAENSELKKFTKAFDAFVQKTSSIYHVELTVHIIPKNRWHSLCLVSRAPCTFIPLTV